MDQTIVVAFLYLTLTSNVQMKQQNPSVTFNKQQTSKMLQMNLEKSWIFLKTKDNSVGSLTDGDSEKINAHAIINAHAKINAQGKAPTKK